MAKLEKAGLQNIIQTQMELIKITLFNTSEPLSLSLTAGQQRTRCSNKGLPQRHYEFINLTPLA